MARTNGELSLISNMSIREHCPICCDVLWMPCPTTICARSKKRGMPGTLQFATKICMWVRLLGDMALRYLYGNVVLAVQNAEVAPFPLFGNNLEGVIWTLTW